MPLALMLSHPLKNKGNKQMKKTYIPLLVIGTSLIAVGCDQKLPNTAAPAAATSTAAPVVEKADAIASVNGKYIPKSTLVNLEKEIAMRGQGQSIPKEKLIEELIQRELLVQDAEKKNLDKTPEVLANVDDAKKSILTQAEVQEFMKNNPVTDAEVKAEYDTKVAGEKAIEYKARHILVKTEAEAKKLLAELDKGADFAKLADKNSLDGKESQNGGDLGWFVASQMVEPFSKAVMALEKGKYTTAPVQTQFGWHIILREDSRPQTPPPLEAVKEQLTPFLQRKKLQTMIENLRKEAKVEILVPLKDEPAKVQEAPAEIAPALPEEAIPEEATTETTQAVEEKAAVVEEKTPAEKPAEKAKKEEKKH